MGDEDHATKLRVGAPRAPAAARARSTCFNVSHCQGLGAQPVFPGAMLGSGEGSSSAPARNPPHVCDSSFSPSVLGCVVRNFALRASLKCFFFM